MIIKSIEVLALLLLAYFIFSQIIWPVVTGVKLFPFFTNKKGKELQKKHVEANQNLTNAQLRQRTARVKRRASKLK